MSRVVVIGAGAMGLAAAYRAAREGHEVDVLEASSEAGGMAGHFDFDGVSIERFYHFICRADQPTFDMLAELGIAGKMVWRDTTMGLFNGGRLYKWGDPFALLGFPLLSFADKVRYGIFAFTCVRRNTWPEIENQSAKDWILSWCGQSVYDRLWKPLFDFKFYRYADDISAAWIWTRIRRIGRSRKSMLQEELGYLEGGTITLVDAFVDAIRKLGGRVHLGRPVTQVLTENGRVTGVQTADGTVTPADAVLCTAPTPLLSKMIPSLPEDWKQRYDAIHNIAVICVIFKLAKPVTPHFWVNISEPGIAIPGLIEFSNLRSIGGESIVYVPYYMPVEEPKFSWPDEALLAEAFAVLQRINPALTADDIRATKVARLRYGQPVCEPGFLAKLPPIQTPIAGLQAADTCFYYPEDRGISESIRIGSMMALAVASGKPVDPRPLVTPIG